MEFPKEWSIPTDDSVIDNLKQRIAAGKPPFSYDYDDEDDGWWAEMSDELWSRFKKATPFAPDARPPRGSGLLTFRMSRELHSLITDGAPLDWWDLKVDEDS